MHNRFVNRQIESHIYISFALYRASDLLFSYVVFAVSRRDPAEFARNNKAAYSLEGWRPAITDNQCLHWTGKISRALLLLSFLDTDLQFSLSVRWRVYVRWQLLSHLAEQKMKHERMVQLQNQIMSENARLHGGLQIAGDNLERTGHISRDLEFANQMVRDENQRSAYECCEFWAAYSTNYSLAWMFRNREKRVYFRVASLCLAIFSLTSSQLWRVVSSLELNFPPSSIFSLRLQDRIQELLETVGALREELRGSFKSSEVALSNMTVERREWQVENASMLTSINGFTRLD